MNVAIMQPYLFPYIGYFQLIRAADVFVCYDDVAYIKGGWVNRNFVLGHGEKQRITLALRGASPNRMIDEISIGANQRKLLESIRQNYARAPHFAAAYAVVEAVLMQSETNLANFLDQGLRTVCQYLGLAPQWRRGSSFANTRALRGVDRVLAICQDLGATRYVNSPGGKALYDKATFAARGIELAFIEAQPIVYRQRGDDFVPNLSIIDVMMFNDRKRCAELVEGYALA